MWSADFCQTTLVVNEIKGVSMSAKKKSRRYRDAVTGRFVTKKYAKKHRKTTVKESSLRAG